MKNEKKNSNRIKFTPDETLDAIPILDSQTSITEIMNAVPEPNSKPSEIAKPDPKKETQEVKEKHPKKTESLKQKAEELKLETPQKKEVSPSQQKVEPEKSNPEVNSEKLNPKAKYSLQFKMMLVISLVIATTVSVMIALATYFFKDDNKKRIESNNLELVRIVKSKVLTDLIAETEKAKILALILKQDFKVKQQKSLFIDQYFKKDNSFFYLGVYKRNQGSMSIVDNIFNKEYIQKISLSEEDILAPINKNLSYFEKSFDGIPSIINASPGFQEAAIAISIPLEEGEKSEFVLVFLLRLEKILDAFKKSGENTTYMVNGEGIVLAHTDMNLVLAAKNLMPSPIVRSMLTSPANNGLSTFEDTDGKKYMGSFGKLGFADAGIVSVVEEDFVFKPIYILQQRNIYIMVIAICISMIIIFLFAKTISTPVLNLLDETIKISRGIFQLDIKRTTNDEVGVLTDYFQNMAKGLEEREKVKSMLGSMIDPIVVSEGMKDLAALKRGDEKLITAFFSDVAGFSSISEQLNSVQLASLLNEYLSAMTLILKAYDGVLDKYIGDAIVGIFGAPIDIGQHYLKASRASLEMIHKLNELRDYWTKNNLYTKEAQEMDIRIGLNTGLAKVGFMGTDAMGSYTMMGDTVNLAARLEAAGKDYGVNILISESVKSQVESELFTRNLDLVRVKGKNEPVKLYELISANSDVSAYTKEAKEMYEEGFKLYLKMEWDKAIVTFQNSEKAKGKKDKAVELLIDRCSYYKNSSPGENWDGVFTRKHK